MNNKTEKELMSPTSKANARFIKAQKKRSFNKYKSSLKFLKVKDLRDEESFENGNRRSK